MELLACAFCALIGWGCGYWYRNHQATLAIGRGEICAFCGTPTSTEGGGS